MKLPNFLEDAALNSLRRDMGATLGDLTLNSDSKRLTLAELDELVGDGIDISSLDEVSAGKDNTLIYKDRRIILYIRDVAEYGSSRKEKESLPRYHVANCRTLIDMREKKRFGRYVVAARADGNFQIFRIGKSKAPKKSLERLKVCQNCLESLGFDGFSSLISQTEKSAIVSGFTLGRFFEVYPRDVVLDNNNESELTARVNDYTGDFGLFAQRAKQRTRFCCQNCKIDLSSRQLQKYLHAHHMNAIKYDNSETNLVPLCIRCHANEPGHSHMLALPDYKRFIELQMSGFSSVTAK